MDCKTALLLWVATLLSASTGCSLFGRSKVEQLEAESERLLTDYRYERERADRLEVLNRALTDRVSQLESRLAIDPRGISRNIIPDRKVPVIGSDASLTVSPWQPTIRR